MRNMPRPPTATPPLSPPSNEVRDELIRNGVALPPFADREPETLSRAREASSVAGERADAANTALLAAVDSLGHADLSSPMHDRIARDGLAALSVALRMSLEGQALIPVIAAERARAVQSAERRIFESRGTDAAKELGLQDVGPVSAGLEKSIGKDVVVLDRATKAIATKLGTSRDDTPGFVYRQSIVDQVLGIQFDALRAHVMLDGEVLFYHQIGTNGVDGNYTGRTRRLDYSVSPIVTMGGKLSLAFDWIHIKDAGVLNGSFETDRFYGANGSITNSGSLGKELGLEGVASTVVDVGAGLLGVRTRVKNAKFTTGEVSEIAVDPSTGRDLGRVGHAPLRIAYTQVDVAYDTAFLLPPEVVGTYWIEELLVGFRYMSYQLPRVLYELTDVSPPRAKNQDFRLTHESPAQKVNSHYYMGGATFRFGQGAEHIVSLFGDLGVYGGAGSAGYELPSQPEEPTAIVIDGSGGLGARLRLTPRKNIFRVLIEAQYHGEVVYQTIVTRLRATQTKDGTTYTADRKIDFGGTDVFHGPRIQVVGIF